jgi:hypothetical protein
MVKTGVLVNSDAFRTAVTNDTKKRSSPLDRLPFHDWSVRSITVSLLDRSNRYFYRLRQNCNIFHNFYSRCGSVLKVNAIWVFEVCESCEWWTESFICQSRRCHDEELTYGKLNFSSIVFVSVKSSGAPLRIQLAWCNVDGEVKSARSSHTSF